MNANLVKDIKVFCVVKKKITNTKDIRVLKNVCKKYKNEKIKNKSFLLSLNITVFRYIFIRNLIKKNTVNGYTKLFNL